MRATARRFGRTTLWLAAVLCASLTGCLGSQKVDHPGIDPAPYQTLHAGNSHFAADPRYEGSLPRELQKVTLPEIVIEPPDILRVELTRVIPPANYKVDAGDILFVQLTYPAQTEPFAGEVLVGPDGQINLGPTFGGMVKVAGLSVDQIREAVEKKAQEADVKKTKATVTLVQSRTLSQIRGEYIVRLDGTIGLGNYGDIRVVGMNLRTAKAAIEAHLSAKLLNPDVSVDVAAYNSKLYYVIYDGGGRGQQVIRLPITGNDTILDAIAQLNGLSPVSSQHHMWLARPSPAAMNLQQRIDIDWVGITQGAATATNYQLFPGDRLYVKAMPLVTFDNYFSMLVAPIERALGVTLLGQTTIQSIRNPNLIGGGGGVP
jgi:polysaccharide biosynthesis/export protein